MQDALGIILKKDFLFLVPHQSRLHADDVVASLVDFQRKGISLVVCLVLSHYVLPLELAEQVDLAPARSDCEQRSRFGSVEPDVLVAVSPDESIWNAVALSRGPDRITLRKNDVEMSERR